MIILRSILFNVCFVSLTILEMLLFMPFYFFLPRRYAWFVPKFWAKTIIFLLATIVGLKIEIEGEENLEEVRQRFDSYIIAPKHQSAWETFAIVLYLDDPSFILKRELMYIPIFGWFMAKMGMIPIDRGSAVASLRKIIAKAKEKIVQKRQILIFPEGTRSLPAAKPHYKAGVATLYSELNLPVLPVAHIAGLFWPKNSFVKYPGVIKLCFLPFIDVGLTKKEFLGKLEDSIETKCDILLEEIQAQNGQKKYPPLLEAVQRRMQR